MQTTQPIKSLKDIRKLKQYYLDRHQIRNYALVTLGMNTSLRISDLLLLKWENVYNFCNKCYFHHIDILEQKTGKTTKIALNKEVLQALKQLKKHFLTCHPTTICFKAGKAEIVPSAAPRLSALSKRLRMNYISKGSSAVTLCGKPLVIMHGRREHLLR